MDQCNHDPKHYDCKKCQSIKLKIEVDHTRYHNPLDVVTEITQRFYQFQDAASRAKTYGHDSDPTIMNQALTELGSIFNPDFEVFAFLTVGLVIPTGGAQSVADIQALYQYYAQYIFNSFSQHYATNLRVKLLENTIPRKAYMTAGGGEHAFIFGDTSTTPASVPVEQETISTFDVEWIELKGGWYINRYIEYGDYITRLNPPDGPVSLYFQRLFPGGTPMTTDPPGQSYPAPPIPPNRVISSLAKPRSGAELAAGWVNFSKNKMITNVSKDSSIPKDIKLLKDTKDKKKDKQKP